MKIEQIRRGVAWFYKHYEGKLSGADRQSFD